MPGFDFDLTEERRPRLGLIVLKSDETIETEFRQIIPGSCDLYHSRIPSQPEVTPETLMQMKADMPTAAAAFPASFGMDVIGYACTSGATIIGPDEVASRIRETHPDAAVTTPITAVVAAFRHLGCRRIGFVTPYIPDVSLAIRDYLEAAGFDIANLVSFEQSEEAVVARIEPRSVLKAIIEVAGDAVDGVFVSCTNLNSFSILDEAEQTIGKPVVSSNLALAWDMLRQGKADLSAASMPGMLFNNR
ncbi:MAG: maleate cis-trans isomerase family protein [Candidatus Puniceispirillales bacterium]